MGIKNFNVNGKNYLFDDVLLGTIVEGLKESKMDAFEPKLPLFIENGKMDIDLSDYSTLVYTNATRDAINTTITDNENISNAKFSHIYDILKYILGDYITITEENMADISADAPKLESYDVDLDETNKHLDKIDNTIDANKEEIENKLLEESILINGRISDHEVDNNKRFTDVENRCKTLEDEVYGSVRTVADGLESYTSRIDSIEEKTDTVYNSLKTLGLLANVIDPPSLNRFDEINNTLNSLKTAIEEIQKEIEDLKKTKE